MRSNPRCVFDTNVVISALLFDKSKPAHAFFAALRNGGVLVSADTISELNEVLSRKKFDKYLTEEERELFLRSLIQTPGWSRSTRRSRLAEIRRTANSWN